MSTIKTYGWGKGGLREKMLEVVYISGTWDLFHVGHLRAIEAASRLGDKLVVGVTTDEFAASYKTSPPVIPFIQRRAIVAALRCVDAAVPTRFPLDIVPMVEYGVTIRAVGPDYGGGNRQPHGHIETIEWMRDQGIGIVHIPRTPDVSTTLIKDRIREEE